MESLQKNILFRLGYEVRNKNIGSTIKKVKQIPGVNNVSRKKDSLIISYEPYSVSEKFLVKCLTGMGFVPATEKKKGFFARWIENLAKTNQENFGKKRLDCCNVKRI